MTTFRGPVARAARCFGGRTALVDAPTGAASSFTAIADAVARMPALLDELGVGAGGRVAILADGSAAYATLYLAIPAAGRVIVPLNTRYTESELRAACDDCTPLLLVTDRPPEQTADLAPVVVGVDEVAASLGPAGPADGGAPEPGEDDAAAIFYTGGTTDRAKGVVLSHRNKLVDALSLVAGLGLDDDDRWLVMSPMFHAAGSFNVVPCLWVGATQVFLPRFDAVTALRAIEEHRITITFGVPTMLRALVAAQREVRADVSSLRLLGHGGAPIAEADVAEVAATFPGVELCAMYGATEMAPMATIHRHQEVALGTPRGRSVGWPVLGVDVTVRRHDGSEAAAGELGEIVVRGPNVMQGYWVKPDATAAVLRDGAYWSGDIGFQDDEGRLHVVDRAKDMIITGGENVYGVEVEGVLAAHPAVVEAAVIGTPDPHWGEIVTAIVVTCAEVGEDELGAHCRASLAGYKVPRRYEFRADPLPRSAAGKLLKRELRG
jgi:long-chain acyl-CoA synthetase